MPLEGEFSAPQADRRCTLSRQQGKLALVLPDRESSAFPLSACTGAAFNLRVREANLGPIPTAPQRASSSAHGSRHTGGTFLPGSPKHFSDMPLLILQATLLGELVTGTAQTGKWRHLGPRWGGAGRLSLRACPLARDSCGCPSPF